VRLLLDTHVVLWWLLDDPTLSDDVKSFLDDEPDLWLSAATIWEIAIKTGSGKLSGPSDLAEHVRDCGFGLLSITADDAMAAARLPPIHRDPFDRVLVAQANARGLALATRDASIQRYDVALMKV
jgi:PIN domain nuclease of toxin-antitoxin system